MKLFEKIKSIFFKNKVKALPEASIETEKVVLLAVKEREPEKVLDILRTYCFEMNSNSIVHIIAHLPMKRRVEGIEIAQKYITPYDLSDLALRKLDYNGKICVLEKFQNRLDLEDMYQLFNNIPPDQRVRALKKCVDRFDSFALSEIIKKYMPLYDRLDCLNLYHTRLDGSSKANIIKELDADRKFTALSKYQKELNKTDLYDIVCSTETDRIPDVLNVVYNSLTSKQISDIIQYYVPEKRKLETLYKCCYRLDSSTISDLIKYTVPEEQKEEALISLQNRIKSNNIGEILQFCVKSANALKKVQHNLDSEDVEYFENTIGKGGN